MDSRLIHYNKLFVVGSSDSTPAHVQKAVQFLGNASLHADKLASHILDLAELDKAYELMQSGEALRVVLTP